MLKPWKDNKVPSGERNELLRTVKRFGRTLRTNWSGYHHLGLVESTIYCIELLGDKLLAKHFSSQVYEINAGVAILNRFTELVQPYN